MSIDKEKLHYLVVKHILLDVSATKWTDEAIIRDQSTVSGHFFEKAIDFLVGHKLFVVQTTGYFESLFPSKPGLKERMEWTGNREGFSTAFRQEQDRLQALDPNYNQARQETTGRCDSCSHRYKLLPDGSKLLAKMGFILLPNGRTIFKEVDADIEGFILDLQKKAPSICTVFGFNYWREESTSQNFEDTPIQASAAPGKGNWPIIPLEIDGEEATIETAGELLEITHPDKHYEKIGAVIEEKNATIVEAIRENTAAINNNTRNQEKAVHNGTVQAQEILQGLRNELDIDKIHRLRQGGMKWKDIVMEVYPDTTIDNLDSEVSRVQKQHKREFPDSYTR